jgi:general secretion pathway protein C
MSAGDDNGPMAARAFAFVIWAALVASAVFWVLRLTASSRPPPPHAVTVAESPVRGDLGRLLGAEPVGEQPAAPTVSDSAFKLVGVVAPGKGVRAGVALISVEGQPAKPYRVGAMVEDLMLLAVEQRAASLGPREGPATLKLELPALPPPSTGTLPAASLDPPQPPPGVPRQGVLPRNRLPPPVAMPPQIQPMEPTPPPEEEEQPPQPPPQPTS